MKFLIFLAMIIPLSASTLGVIKDSIGEVYISSTTELSSSIKNNTLVETEDGVAVIQLIDNTSIVMLENSSILFKDNYISVKKGNVYFQNSLQHIILPQITLYSEDSADYMISIIDDTSLIRVRRGYITIYRSEKFLDNFILEESEMILGEKTSEFDLENIFIYSNEYFKEFDYYLEDISPELEEYLSNID